MMYPEIAPLHPKRTKSSQVSASRAGSVLPKKGEWQLSNIWQLGTMRMVAVREIGELWEKNVCVMIEEAEGKIMEGCVHVKLIPW